MWKRRTRGVRWGSGRRAQANRCGRVENVSEGIETGGVDMAPGQVWRIPVYWPGGARHGGDASPICGIHAERGKAGSDSSTCGWGEGVSRAAETGRDRVPMQDPPADRPVVVRKLL